MDEICSRGYSLRSLSEVSPHAHTRILYWGHKPNYSLMQLFIPLQLTWCVRGGVRRAIGRAGERANGQFPVTIKICLLDANPMLQLLQCFCFCCCCWLWWWWRWRWRWHRWQQLIVNTEILIIIAQLLYLLHVTGLHSCIHLATASRLIKRCCFCRGFNRRCHWGSRRLYYQHF